MIINFRDDVYIIFYWVFLHGRVAKISIEFLSTVTASLVIFPITHSGVNSLFALYLYY